MATVSTTFTFSSTDISSDALSFTVSENLSLTGSGGIVRFNLNAKYTGAMEDPNLWGPRKGTDAYEIYAGSGSSNHNAPSGSVPTFLYIKNVTGSGYSASAGGPTMVHLMDHMMWLKFSTVHLHTFLLTLMYLIMHILQQVVEEQD